MLDIIKADLYRYQPRDYSILCLFKGFRSQGFRYMFFRRLRDHYGKGNPISTISSLFIKYYMYKYGFQIGGKIGPGFYIGHFGTIIVSVNAIIGNNCNISPGVTIGATRRGENKGSPKIGNYVWIGTNAIIVGGINIGNDVLIAPGAFVNFDVHAHSILVGNPARITPRENATAGYINNVLNEY